MSLNLRVDETDPDLKRDYGRYSDWKAFGVLRRYLEPTGDLSMDEAVYLIHDMLPTSPTTPDGKHLAGQPDMLGCQIQDVARQIPYDHPAQTKLVRLLKKLRSSDRLTKHYPGERFSSYLSMQEFELHLREVYGAGFEIGTDDEAHFKNIRAFIARLSASGIYDGINWAIWTMRNSLEVEMDMPSSSIVGAAVWILYAGQWLFDEIVRYPRNVGPDELPWGNGPLYTGPILGLERWKFWQKAFAAAAEREDVNEECKRLSLKATISMGALAQACL